MLRTIKVLLRYQIDSNFVTKINFSTPPFAKPSELEYYVLPLTQPISEDSYINKIKSTATVTILLWLTFLFSGACHSAPDAISLEFRIPSNATSTTSRLFYNLVKEFERKHPEIEIELIPSNTWDQVTVDVIARTKTGRDAGVYISEVSTTRELEKAHAVISFEDAINNYGKELFGTLEAFKKLFVSETMLENSYGLNGDLYGPPFIRSTPIAYYNMDELEKIGYTEASLPETWEDMAMLLKKYKQETQRMPFGFGAAWSDYLFEATVRQAGGSLMTDDYSATTFNSPEAVSALRFWKELSDNDLLRKTNSWKATINGFAGGLFPVIYYSSGGIGVASKLAKFKWAVKTMPMKSFHSVSFGGGNLYISSLLSRPKLRAALTFIHFLYSAKVQTAISEETGFFPVTKEAFGAIRNTHLNQLKHQFTNNQVHGKTMTTENLKTRIILKEAIDEVLFGDANLKMALDEAQLKAVKLLGKH